jgi:uncharacterized protein (TIGR03382 family)
MIVYDAESAGLANDAEYDAPIVQGAASAMGGNSFKGYVASSCMEPGEYYLSIVNQGSSQMQLAAILVKALTPAAGTDGGYLGDCEGELFEPGVDNPVIDDDDDDIVEPPADDDDSEELPGPGSPCSKECAEGYVCAEIAQGFKLCMDSCELALNDCGAGEACMLDPRGQSFCMTQAETPPDDEQIGDDDAAGGDEGVPVGDGKKSKKSGGGLCSASGEPASGALLFAVALLALLKRRFNRMLR